MESKFLFTVALVFLGVQCSVILSTPVGLDSEQPQPGQNTENVVWFPNPDTNSVEKLIPAYLNSPIGYEPAAADLSKLHFYLYTKSNPTTAQELFVGDSDALARSNFRKGGQLKIMSHGFGGNYDHSFPWNTRGKFLTMAGDDMNVILLNWSQLAANPDYVGAVVNAYAVSNHTARLLEFLLTEQATTLDKVHIIGYSLGGQVAGIAAKRFSWFTNGLIVPRVTALDPAFPLFDVANDDDRVSPDCGEFVDVIHTAGGTLGMVQPRGHADFYPNGGSKQPGCGIDIVGSCSHSRAPAFFDESIFGVTPFSSCKCTDWAEFNGGSCACNEKADLGYWTEQRARGKFYLKTNAEEPYAIG